MDDVPMDTEEFEEEGSFARFKFSRAPEPMPTYSYPNASTYRGPLTREQRRNAGKIDYLEKLVAALAARYELQTAELITRQNTITGKK